jgi:hypothetical protein
MRYGFLDCSPTVAFDFQRFLFVPHMINNVKLAIQKSFDVNLVIELWKTFISSRILVNKIPEYIKLVELIIVQVNGCVEDECYFLTLTFMKKNLQIG